MGLCVYLNSFYLNGTQFKTVRQNAPTRRAFPCGRSVRDAHVSSVVVPSAPEPSACAAAAVSSEVPLPSQRCLRCPCLIHSKKSPTSVPLARQHGLANDSSRPVRQNVNCVSAPGAAVRQACCVPNSKPRRVPHFKKSQLNKQAY